MTFQQSNLQLCAAMVGEPPVQAMDRAAVTPARGARLSHLEVGQTPSEVVYEENKLRLRRYEPLVEQRYDVPVVFVYSLINRPYIFDLHPDRSVVRRFLERGFDVYLLDWGEPSALDATLRIDDYVNRYLDNCIDVVRDRCGVESVTLLGYCMGGTLSAIYAALHPEKVRTLVLLAAGLDFEEDAGILMHWSHEEYFDEGRLSETFGNVPAEFLDLGFVLLEPVENTVTKYGTLYDNLADDEFFDLFARMERWVRDGVDMAGATYSEFVNDLYQHNELARNELRVDHSNVDLGNVDMPVLQIVGSSDHLVPPVTSKPFNDLIPSEETAIIEFPSGHVGLSISSGAHARLWPEVCEWIGNHS